MPTASSDTPARRAPPAACSTANGSDHQHRQRDRPALARPAGRTGAPVTAPTSPPTAPAETDQARACSPVSPQRRAGRRAPAASCVIAENRLEMPVQATIRRSSGCRTTKREPLGDLRPQRAAGRPVRHDVRRRDPADEQRRHAGTRPRPPAISTGAATTRSSTPVMPGPATWATARLVSQLPVAVHHLVAVDQRGQVALVGHVEEDRGASPVTAATTNSWPSVEHVAAPTPPAATPSATARTRSSVTSTRLRRQRSTHAPAGSPTTRNAERLQRGQHAHLKRRRGEHGHRHAPAAPAGSPACRSG